MSFRLLALFCLALIFIPAPNAEADLIFSLQPVQIGVPTSGPTTNSDAFIDLLIESDSSDQFNSFGYSVNISPIGSTPASGLAFGNPLVNESSDSNFVFFGNSTLLTSTINASPQSIFGGDIRTPITDITLTSADGPRLLSRLELDFLPSLSLGDSFTISLDPLGTFAGSLVSPPPPPFAVGPDVVFTFDAAAAASLAASTTVAAVPEPSSITALGLLAGGMIYRRRKSRR